MGELIVAVSLVLVWIYIHVQNIVIRALRDKVRNLDIRVNRLEERE